MCKTKNSIAISILALSSFAGFAGTMGATTAAPGKFYLGIEGGDSISLNTHFQPNIVYPRATDYLYITPENTDWTRDIGAAGFGGVFLGYEWNPNVAFAFDYSYRGNYNWSILTVENTLVVDPNLAPYPDVYDRYKAGPIRIQTFLFDMLLKPAVNWGGLMPYIKGGIGLSINNISYLQNIDVPYSTNQLSFNNTQSGKSTNNFAWDVGLGADYYLTQKLSVGLAYRFVDTGKLQTGYSTSGLGASDGDTITPFIANHVYLNELSVSAAYHFDFMS